MGGVGVKVGRSISVNVVVGGVVCCGVEGGDVLIRWLWFGCEFGLGGFD